MYWVPIKWLALGWYLTYIFNQFYLHDSYEIYLLLLFSNVSIQNKGLNYSWIIGLLQKKQ